MVLRVAANRADRLRGTAGDDTLDGRGGDDLISGLGGDDILLGGPGRNRLDGGAGRDAAGVAFGDELQQVVGGPTPVRADLAAGTYALAGAVSALVAVEDAFGSTVGDRLSGDGLANRLFGLEGDDLVLGRGGDDLLVGGEGRDRLLGGAGDDTLDSSSSADDAPDEVSGGAGDDLLRLSGSGDGARGGAGADQFQAGTAVLGEDRGALFAVRDFDPAGGDAIGLPAFSSLDGEDTQQAYAFLGGRPLAANGVAEVRFEHLRGGGTLVQYEAAEGALRTVNEILLDGPRLALGADDFLLGFATTAGDDRVTGTGFADRVLAGPGDDEVAGLAGADEIAGGDGADRLDGGEGDDVIEGGGGDDALAGGEGDDVLSDVTGAEASDDTYLFEGRFGRDEVADLSGSDEVVFGDLSRRDVTLSRDGFDLVVAVPRAGDSVRVVSFYEDFVDVELVFGGGRGPAEGAIA